MAKYGRGLNREIVAAVNAGELREPLTTHSVWGLVGAHGWETTPAYIGVCLANGTSGDHSPTYKKYFENVGDGEYRVKFEYRGPNWR